MKFKLDENLGRRAVELLAQAGHDVATVPSEGLFSAAGENLIEICRREGRCLVMLDLDFSNPLLFKPSEYAGIAVLWLPRKPSYDDLLEVVKALIGGLGRGKHWWKVVDCPKETRQGIPGGCPRVWKRPRCRCMK